MINITVKQNITQKVQNRSAQRYWHTLVACLLAFWSQNTEAF